MGDVYTIVKTKKLCQFSLVYTVVDILWFVLQYNEYCPYLHRVVSVLKSRMSGNLY